MRYLRQNERLCIIRENRYATVLGVESESAIVRTSEVRKTFFKPCWAGSWYSRQNKWPSRENSWDYNNWSCMSLPSEWISHVCMYTHFRVHKNMFSNRVGLLEQYYSNIVVTWDKTIGQTAKTAGFVTVLGVSRIRFVIAAKTPGFCNCSWIEWHQICDCRENSWVCNCSWSEWRIRLLLLFVIAAKTARFATLLDDRTHSLLFLGDKVASDFRSGKGKICLRSVGNYS